MSKQQEDMREKVKAALTAAPRTGELPDSALEAVAGGAFLNADAEAIYRMSCRKCGWRSDGMTAPDWAISMCWPWSICNSPRTATRILW